MIHKHVCGPTPDSICKTTANWSKASFWMLLVAPINNGFERSKHMSDLPPGIYPSCTLIKSTLEFTSARLRFLFKTLFFLLRKLSFFAQKVQEIKRHFNNTISSLLLFLIHSLSVFCTSVSSHYKPSFVISFLPSPHAESYHNYKTLLNSSHISRVSLLSWFQHVLLRKKRLLEAFNATLPSLHTWAKQLVSEWQRKSQPHAYMLFKMMIAPTYRYHLLWPSKSLVPHPIFESYLCPFLYNTWVLSLSLLVQTIVESYLCLFFLFF